MIITTTVNGEQVEADVPADTLLIDFLRDELGLTGTKRSCDIQVCGACTVLVDGRPVSSCCALAVEVGDSTVQTIEGLGSDEGLDPIQQAFLDQSAFQCGFCTSGFIVTLAGMRNYLPDKEVLAQRMERELSGSICRCGTYKNILAAAKTSLLGVTDEEEPGSHAAE